MPSALPRSVEPFASGADTVPCRWIRIDLAGLRFLDAAGIQALIECAQHATARGAKRMARPGVFEKVAESPLIQSLIGQASARIDAARSFQDLTESENGAGRVEPADLRHQPLQCPDQLVVAGGLVDLHQQPVGRLVERRGRGPSVVVSCVAGELAYERP